MKNDRIMLVNLDREKRKRKQEMLNHMKEFNKIAA